MAWKYKKNVLIALGFYLYYDSIHLLILALKTIAKEAIISVLDPNISKESSVEVKMY